MSKEAEDYLSIYREKNSLSDLYKDEQVAKEVSGIMQAYAEHYHREKVNESKEYLKEKGVGDIVVTIGSNGEYILVKDILESYLSDKLRSYTSGNAADDQNKFYIKAGYNAYFGNGFNYGVQALREHLLKEKE